VSNGNVLDSCNYTTIYTSLEFIYTMSCCLSTVGRDLHFRTWARFLPEVVILAKSLLLTLRHGRTTRVGVRTRIYHHHYHHVYCSVWQNKAKTSYKQTIVFTKGKLILKVHNNIRIQYNIIIPVKKAVKKSETP